MAAILPLRWTGFWIPYSSSRVCFILLEGTWPISFVMNSCPKLLSPLLIIDLAAGLLHERTLGETVLLRY